MIPSKGAFGIHGGAESGPGDFRNPPFAILDGPGPQFESSNLVGWFNARNPQPFGGSVAEKWSNQHSSEGFPGHPSRESAKPTLTKPPGRDSMSAKSGLWGSTGVPGKNALNNLLFFSVVVYNHH